MKTTILFSDAAISFLNRNKVPSDSITALIKYIQDEEFETDSIHIDIEDDIGNIRNAIKNNKSIVTLVNRLIANNKSMLCCLFNTHCNLHSCWLF